MARVAGLHLVVCLRCLSCGSRCTIPMEASEPNAEGIVTLAVNRDDRAWGNLFGRAHAGPFQSVSP